MISCFHINALGHCHSHKGVFEMRKWIGLLAILPSLTWGQAVSGQGWSQIVADAQAQTVYWAAWGGDDSINAYIDWVRERVDEDFGIELVHVKLADTAAAVQSIETEFAAGKTSHGSIDLIWINGENFARLKRQGLLGAGFSESLPIYALIDFENKLTLTQDFSEAVEGLESPWGLAQFTFLYDRSLMDTFPGDAAALLSWAQANPGRFAYPAPPNFVGTTFLKQLALELVADPTRLYAPADAHAQGDLAPLWAYLDALHAVAWRRGQAFAQTHIDLRDLFNRDEIDVLLTFNPGDATSLVAQGVLPATIAAAGFASGSIGNAHFVAIPGNSSARAGAMVVANFLLSPQAQGRKADPAIWGDTTVLNLNKLNASERAFFPDVVPALGPAVLEPHATWVEVLETGWAARYAN